ncbi:hypothetical protein JTB14_023361 [Gonioctena quinquepunctata]|nr:hypothetical protein JTB14_023361 [Gonioctena quinquepunctata]
MAMSKKHLESGGILCGNTRAARCPLKASSHQGSPPQRCSPFGGECSVQRLNPKRGQSQSPQGSNQGSSPRTSPGLVAGHYAGCKFSEPPLPSALPLPPQHWMQSSRTLRLPFHPVVSDHRDVTQQLRMLLKVQA